LTDREIADLHTVKYGKITSSAIHEWRVKWNLHRPSPFNPFAYWKIATKLLGEGRSLENIYETEFKYTYDPNDRSHRNNLREKYQEWFAHDSKVKDDKGEVSLAKIVEVYGSWDVNYKLLRFQTESQWYITVSKRSEGWSLERIYTEMFGYVYDPSNSKHRFRMREKFREIFKNDPLVWTSGDILSEIEDVYNPINKL